MERKEDLSRSCAAFLIAALPGWLWTALRLVTRIKLRTGWSREILILPGL